MLDIVYIMLDRIKANKTKTILQPFIFSYVKAKADQSTNTTYSKKNN